ncbi:unnamed protein product [Phytomonas sp. Hart1]|nr:unnamed protein product [Phytomonas sp. Hart1]|eukprot:CCW68021.1 unnamed protein product [Phytomonas sp. isolate Hart1]
MEDEMCSNVPMPVGELVQLINEYAVVNSSFDTELLDENEVVSNGTSISSNESIASTEGEDNSNLCETPSKFVDVIRSQTEGTGVSTEGHGNAMKVHHNIATSHGTASVESKALSYRGEVPVQATCLESYCFSCIGM